MRNLSAHDYGCTQVFVDRAGTGTKQFWNINTTDFLMDKTFKIFSATNNASGKYEVTFYYTKEEREGWEAATGQSWNSIQLIKVPSAISSVTPLIAQPDGPGTVQVVTPTRSTFGTGYTLTHTFENGFSGFGAGIPGRMNTILTLTGQVNNTVIVLNWTTSAEISSSTFEIEKSYNGKDFRKIGTVQAAGNKLSLSAYSFTDRENVEINYYRVRMLHTDNYLLLSDTIIIKNNNAPQRLFILTNPFNNEIRVRFGRVPRGRMAFSLFDISGRLIKQYKTSPGSSDLVFYNIRTQNVVSRAIYILDVFVDGKHFTKRVMKE